MLSVKGLTISRNSDAVPIAGLVAVVPTGSAANRMLAKNSSNSGFWSERQLRRWVVSGVSVVEDCIWITEGAPKPCAIGRGAYILLTQRIGDRFTGIGALSMTVPIAAATAAVAGIPQAAGQLTFGILAAAAGLAILLPVLPFALEMLALRRMTPTAFGTLMALEPAVGVLLGLLILHQQPSAVQAVGILLVILAGAAAQRSGPRRPAPPESSPSHAEPDYVG